MTDCATQLMRFETEARLPLEAAFDGGRLTSDGGLLWLEKMDEELDEWVLPRLNSAQIRCPLSPSKTTKGW